jgi:hypothetical protein
MDSFLKSQADPNAHLWDMVLADVFRPIGIFHAPMMSMVWSSQQTILCWHTRPGTSAGRYRPWCVLRWPSHGAVDDPLVQLGTIEYPRLGGHGRYGRHDFGHGFRGPGEWMRPLIPFTDALRKLRAQVILRGTIHNAQPLAL